MLTVHAGFTIPEHIFSFLIIKACIENKYCILLADNFRIELLNISMKYFADKQLKISDNFTILKSTKI